ncbi:MAG: hypothetical protein A3F42_07220 [Gammaproteobacteria bacterium RIFCSPHIGHO2_12_FULL_37_34]|nr:MAG: hypothetical protein A3F42_07220 [Gammaproteobacteria bacterium RIFCSPHIGHO2_12_FULL_37_34]
MLQFSYRGRDKEGRLRTGQRQAADADSLNTELLKEGISVFQISLAQTKQNYWDKIQTKFQNDRLHLDELAIFARQMQLLHQANVPMVTAIKQLASYTRSQRLARALYSIIDDLEKGQTLSVAMQQHVQIFSPIMVSIVQIGEKTGHLSDAFGYVHQYLEFESNTRKQIKTIFRYPLFVLISIFSAFIILNIFVIPTFAKFYVNLDIPLPWQTYILINLSNFLTHYGGYTLLLLVLLGAFIFRYLRTAQGKYRWHKYELRLPLIGSLLKRVILIRFARAFKIVIHAGISIDQGLLLIRDTLTNTYVIDQVTQVQEAIKRGMGFTNAIVKITLLTPLEIQILSVGEKNGELGPAFDYIANFHSHEIEFDLKRINDQTGPILTGIMAILILIVALGVYLPVWNMVDLIKT